MTQYNPLHWKRSRLGIAVALVLGAAAVGTMIGYHWAWSIISAERLNPADPYIPVIYEKFTAAWAVGRPQSRSQSIFLKFCGTAAVSA